MPKTSVGLLMYRTRQGALEVFLVHPGGPFWAKKDLGAWTIPKGEPGPTEEPLAGARREFEEETGVVPSGEFVALNPVRQAGGKMVRAWAFQGDTDAARIRSNTFTMEWPPRSGRQAEFPEVDRAAWFGLADAKQHINSAQVALLEELERITTTDHPQPGGP